MSVFEVCSEPRKVLPSCLFPGSSLAQSFNICSQGATSFLSLAYHQNLLVDSTVRSEPPQPQYLWGEPQGFLFLQATSSLLSESLSWSWGQRE